MRRRCPTRTSARMASSTCSAGRRANPRASASAAPILSLPQALNLINGKTISDAVADPNGRVTKAVLAGKSEAAIVEDLYLATLSRLPTKEEAASGVEVSFGRTARNPSSGSCSGLS